MALKASDLPDDLKKQLLNQIRDQMGSSQYDQMVNALGEDGTIDLLLEQASKGQVSKGATTSGKPKSGVKKEAKSDNTNPFIEALSIIAVGVSAGPGYLVATVVLWIGQFFDWITHITLHSDPYYGSRMKTQSWKDSEPGQGCVITAIVLGLSMNAVVGMGPSGLLVLGSIYLAVLLYLLISRLIKRYGLGQTFKVGAIVSGVVTGGCVLWIGGPWLIESVGLWWTWLGGHF